MPRILSCRPAAHPARCRSPYWHEAFIADLDPNGIEEHQRVADIERPVLPFRNLVQHRVGNRRDQIRRNLDAVEFLEMATDFADRHPARIHRDDFVVEIREPTLVFGDQLRIKCSSRSRGTDSVIFEVPVRTDFFE